MRASLKKLTALGAVSVTLAATSTAFGADISEGYGHHRRDARRHAVVVDKKEVIVVPSESYERPLYEGPAFFYRPYYGAGPALQWFDFGLGRDKNGYP
jgi:hypothetical protein